METMSWGRPPPAARPSGCASLTVCRPGHRSAAVLVAWEDDDAIDAWLGRASSNAPEERLARCTRDLAAVRQRGYAVELRAPIQERVALLADELRTAVRDRRATARIHDLLDHAVSELADEDVLLIDIDADRSYQPNSINAPVFDVDGSVALVGCLVDALAPLAGPAIVAIGERVGEVITELTGSLRGRLPPVT